MTISFIFWLLMLLWAVFGAWVYRRRPVEGPAWIIGSDVVLFILLFLLGWQAFGWPIKG